MLAKVKVHQMHLQRRQGQAPREEGTGLVHVAASGPP